MDVILMVLLCEQWLLNPPLKRLADPGMGQRSVLVHRHRHTPNSGRLLWAPGPSSTVIIWSWADRCWHARWPYPGYTPSASGVMSSVGSGRGHPLHP